MDLFVKKPCLRGLRWSDIQTRLLSYRDKLENQNFDSSKSRYNTFQKVNNKGADQTYGQAGLRLCCSRTPEDRFLVSRPICDLNIYKKNLYFFSVCNSCCNVCIYSKYGARGKGEWEHNQCWMVIDKYEGKDPGQIWEKLLTKWWILTVQQLPNY